MNSEPTRTYQPSKNICESSIPEDPNHLNKKYYRSSLNEKILCEDCIKKIYDEFTRIIDVVIQRYKQNPPNNYALSNWRKVDQVFDNTIHSPFRVLGMSSIDVSFSQTALNNVPYIPSATVTTCFQGENGATSLQFPLTEAYNYDALRMMVEQILNAHLTLLSNDALEILRERPACPKTPEYPGNIPLL